MVKAKKHHSQTNPITGLKKCPTGINGLDEVTLGGLPQGRPIIIRQLPGPLKRIIGDLSGTKRVLVGLDIRNKQ
ncbi:hypothetical protein AL013_04900 [Mariprofundus ferrooxydans]|nr:hypothetical protein [Mariprofundus ferrooxydans]KON48088.1 hypothetical protein AL013_04900 [Mariprofundus ferrooxydans]